MSTQTPMSDCLTCGFSKSETDEKLVNKNKELQEVLTELEKASTSTERAKELNALAETLEDQIDKLKDLKSVKITPLNKQQIKTLKKKRQRLANSFDTSMLNAKSEDERQKLKTEKTDRIATMDMLIDYYSSRENSTGICSNCVSKLAEIHGVAPKDNKLPAATAANKSTNLSLDNIPTPDELRQFLDTYVIGQNMAKTYIAGAVALHYRRAARMLSGEHDKLDKSNILLIGPTGVGKTEILRTLTRCLSKTLGQIPMTSKSATKITEAGYVGDDAESVIESLFNKALQSIKTSTGKTPNPGTPEFNEAVRLTQLGIVHIDEVDKISDDGSGAGGSVSRKGAQNALLTMMEGDTIDIKYPIGPGQVVNVTIDTSTILFITSGAFMGVSKESKSIYDIARERREKNSSSSTGAGFLAVINSATNDTLENYASKSIDDIEPEDVVNYGLGHEFVGRLANIITLSKLSESALARIVVEPKGAILPSYIRDMKDFYDINVILSEDAEESTDSLNNAHENDTLCAIAKRANERKTGARAIQSVINRVTFFITSFPGKLKGKYILITKESVSDPEKVKVLDEIGGQFTYIGDLLAPTLQKIEERDLSDNGKSSKKPSAQENADA